MPGIAVTIAIIATTQVVVLAAPSSSAWFPFAAPALWAMEPERVSPAQLAATIPAAIGFAALTASAWNRLQLDR